MNDSQNASDGVALAQRAIHALADNEEGLALAAINSGSPEQIAWAAAYLLSALRESVSKLAGGDPALTAQMLHAGADDLEDPIMADVAQIGHQTLKDMGLT